jgi:hypothetical protein
LIPRRRSGIAQMTRPAMLPIFASAAPTYNAMRKPTPVFAGVP